MSERRLGIIMNGVTGRMGKNQHLIRSILAIRDAGGVSLPDGVRVMPDPLLVGRDAGKLKQLAEETGVSRWTNDLAKALKGDDEVYFDTTLTASRVANVKQAIAAGKHLYCEKPIANDVATAVGLAQAADDAGLKHGVVQDKLWVPGLRKLQRLVKSGFFGRILSVRGEFGYWVFEGDWQEAQRPSWNYRREDGGGIIDDMLCHWRYVLDNIFGSVERVSCLGATHIPERWDEQGERYTATADDAAYATFELAGGIIAHVNSSWCVRVRRDELVTFQVDGTEGSAVAGLRKCYIQPREATPKPVWNPDVEQPHDFFGDWKEVPDNQIFDNAFKIEWEHFIRHVCADTPFKWNLWEGAKGVQLSELGHQSWRDRCWVDVPALR